MTIVGEFSQQPDPFFREALSSATTASPGSFSMPGRTSKAYKPALPWGWWTRGVKELSVATLHRDLEIENLLQDDPCAVQFIESRGYQLTLSRLRELRKEPETDEYGVARPSEGAYRLCLKLLKEAEDFTMDPMPPGSPSTDSEGGIRMTWTSEGRELRLIVLSSEQSYLYHESGGSYDLQTLRSGKELARRLDWLTRGGSGSD